VVLPETSWPTHEVALALHLPAVFEYAWVDGSLAPVALPATDAPEWSYDLPEPGKSLWYRQLLVTRSAPHLDGEVQARAELVTLGEVACELVPHRAVRGMAGALDLGRGRAMRHPASQVSVKKSGSTRSHVPIRCRAPPFT
jgi:hypothetical protein